MISVTIFCDSNNVMTYFCDTYILQLDKIIPKILRDPLLQACYVSLYIISVIL